MNFDLTLDQEVLRKSVRELAESEIKPLARDCDEKEVFSRTTMRSMAEFGLFGFFVAEEYGGQGMDYLSYIIAAEEIARVDGSHAATMAAGNSLGIGPIYYFGSEEQKRKYLPELCAGEALWGFGLTEPKTGSDAGSVQTSAVLDGDDWIVNGHKLFITNGSTDITAGVTILCRTGQKEDGRSELSCLLVEAGTEGFEARTMQGKMMWRGSNTAHLVFENCRVPRENLLGTRGRGLQQMLATLDSGRLSIAAMGLGGAQGAYELGLNYAKERQQFSQPVAAFQANSFKLADCAMQIECARLLLYKACWLRDQGRPFQTESSMAKLFCSQVMKTVVDHAVQLHGGYGLIKSYDIERFYRDQRVLEIGEGTSEIQRILIAREIGAL